MINEKYKYRGDRGMYLDIARDIISVTPGIKSILKTDCHNEAHGRPKGGILPNLLNEYKGLQYKTFDIDPDRLRRARANFPLLKIDMFDLRFTNPLPYSDKTFNLILDFSTLDHLSYRRAEEIICEYDRMLVDNGQLCLIVWTADSEEFTIESCPDEEWNPDYQFFFLKSSTVTCLKKYFIVDDKGSLLDRDNRSLTYLLCRKSIS